MNFPQHVSFTLTNRCNLRCRMCGQWSDEGYMHGMAERMRNEMALSDWKRLADEAADNGVGAVLLRGGEPFLYPDIIDLIEHMVGRGMFVPIDTNGTFIEKHANDLVRIGSIHLTISVDGPEPIHDRVRGVKGCFEMIRKGQERLREAAQKANTEISRSICFVISPDSLPGLGDMPDVTRDLGIDTIAVVPYFYVCEKAGREYERVLKEKLGCPAFSWQGFHHEESGVNFDEFRVQYRKYLENLGGIKSYPYMPLSEDEYRTWFENPTAQVGAAVCNNVERLIDIQPNGDANFCVDAPDYCFGNVRESTITEVWNSARAERFREYRRAQPLPVCARCVAKHMS